MLIIECVNASMLEHFVDAKEIKRNEKYFYIELPIFNDLFLMEDIKNNSGIINKEVTTYNAYNIEITEIISEANKMIFNLAEKKIDKQSRLYKSFLRVLVISMTVLQMSGPFGTKEKTNVYYRALAIHIMNCLGSSNTLDYYKDELIDDLIKTTHEYHKNQVYLDTCVGSGSPSKKVTKENNGYKKIVTNSYGNFKKFVVDEQLIYSDEVNKNYYIYVDLTNYLVVDKEDVSNHQYKTIELEYSTLRKYEEKIERYIISLKDNYFSKNSKLYKTLLQMAIVDDVDFQRSCQLINHYQLNGKIQVYYDYDVSTLLKTYPITEFRRVLKGH